MLIIIIIMLNLAKYGEFQVFSSNTNRSRLHSQINMSRLKYGKVANVHFQILFFSLQLSEL
jgi:hypothetical protein